MAMEVRPAAVAGAFYPAGTRELAAAVEALLAQVPPTETAWVPKALIVPHAGYVYSGRTAAAAYACLKTMEASPRRVALFGPAHYYPVPAIAASGATHFQTPLGLVPLDRALIRHVLTSPHVSIMDEAHEREHSLEVQLPFLQTVLPEFQLAPFAVGRVSTDVIAEVMELAWEDPDTLLIVSSDLSHYYDYETARQMDQATAKAILSLSPQDITSESACGAVPIRGLLQVAAKRGLTAHLLDLRNSGDTAGSRNRVVGYGAFCFTA